MDAARDGARRGRSNALVRRSASARRAADANRSAAARRGDEARSGSDGRAVQARTRHSAAARSFFFAISPSCGRWRKCGAILSPMFRTNCARRSRSCAVISRPCSTIRNNRPAELLRILRGDGAALGPAQPAGGRCPEPGATGGARRGLDLTEIDQAGVFCAESCATGKSVSTPSISTLELDVPPDLPPLQADEAGCRRSFTICSITR